MTSNIYNLCLKIIQKSATINLISTSQAGIFYVFFTWIIYFFIDYFKVVQHYFQHALGKILSILQNSKLSLRSIHIFMFYYALYA